MISRLSKSALVLSAALYATLVALGNITDYDTNFAFVRHVLLMDTTFPGNGIMYRAIQAPWLHHAAYLVIIALECLTALLCWHAGLKMLAAARRDHAAFARARGHAVAGLTCGFLTWQVVFMSIGGEWFGMWMSPTWNGVQSAFRIFVMFLLILIYLSMDERPAQQASTPREL